MSFVRAVKGLKNFGCDSIGPNLVKCAVLVLASVKGIDPLFINALGKEDSQRFVEFLIEAWEMLSLRI